MMLLQWHAEYGPRWFAIAKMFGTDEGEDLRTPAMVRNRHMRLVKGKKVVEEAQRAGKTVNKCGKCGMPKRGHICSASAFPTANLSETDQRQRHMEARRLQEEDMERAAVNALVSSSMSMPPAQFNQAVVLPQSSSYAVVPASSYASTQQCLMAPQPEAVALESHESKEGKRSFEFDVALSEDHDEEQRRSKFARGPLPSSPLLKLAELRRVSSYP